DKPIASPTEYLDIHAGEYETSVMLHAYPETCRNQIIPTLAPTNLTASDLEIWRRGHDTAARVTPSGYFGDPAHSLPQSGERLLREDAEQVANAIARCCRSRLSPSRHASHG